MKRFQKFIRPALFAAIALLLAAPANVFACATCYASGADPNNPMGDGMNWAILTLGVFIATILVVFLIFLIHVIRKSEAVEAASQPKPPQPAKV